MLHFPGMWSSMSVKVRRGCFIPFSKMATRRLSVATSTLSSRTCFETESNSSRVTVAAAAMQRIPTIDSETTAKRFMTRPPTKLQSKIQIRADHREKEKKDHYYPKYR